MPIDPTLLPALEEELASAKKPKPGGQLPRKERIAAIEEQIALCLEALNGGEGRAPEKPQESNVSTDYTSHDAKEDQPAKRGRPKKLADGEELETADATEPKDETVIETA